MSFNTDTFKQPKVKKATLWGYRGVSAGLIIWMFSTFPTKDEFNRLREWQLSNSRKISELQSKIQALELTTVKVKPHE